MKKILSLIVLLSSICNAQNRIDLNGKKLVLFDNDRINTGRLESFLSADTFGYSIDLQSGPQKIYKGDTVFLKFYVGHLVYNACITDGYNCTAKAIKIYLRFSDNENFVEYVSLYNDFYFNAMDYDVPAPIKLEVPNYSNKIEVFAIMEKAYCRNSWQDSTGREHCDKYEPIGTGYVSNYGFNFQIPVSN